jgi:hypothetical protein
MKLWKEGISTLRPERMRTGLDFDPSLADLAVDYRIGFGLRTSFCPESRRP